MTETRTTKITGLVLILLITVLNIWFWFMLLPVKLISAAKEIHAPAVELVPEYDCYEFYGDYPTEEAREGYRARYRAPATDTNPEPSDMLECEAGDHTCID